MNGYRDEPATKRDLDQLKQELIAKIDTNSNKIDTNSNKIDANGKKIDANGKKIDTNGNKIDANGKKIDQVEKKLTHRIDQVEQSLSAKIDANTASIGRLTAQVTKNGEAIKETLTREEYKKDYNELLRGQDEMMVVLLRIDQERAATNARIDRVERDVERLKAG